MKREHGAMPRPAEIAEACQEIQSHWNRQQRRQRQRWAAARQRQLFGLMHGSGVSIALWAETSQPALSSPASRLQTVRQPALSGDLGEGKKPHRAKSSVA